MIIIFFGSKAYKEIISRLDAIQKATEVPTGQKSDYDVKRWLTVSGLSAILPVSEKTIRRWAKENIIPCKRAGRLYLFDTNAVIEQLERTSEKRPK